MKKIFKTYKKLFSLLLCLIIVVIGTLLIKYYFKPFLIMVIMVIVCNPLYKFLLSFKIPNKISGILCIIIINILLIIIVSYLGNEVFNIIKSIYVKNLQWINKFIHDITGALNLDFNNFRIGKNVFSIINDKSIRQGAINTGEGILAYFMANICTFFILIDRKYISEVIKLLFPKETIIKFRNQKNNFTHMITIEGTLVLLSTFEIIVGFIILKVPNFFMLGIVCGLLDVLPYVGTIIVFIPIIIYNIIMRNYIIVFGLICLYILVEVVREILEAKFLGAKLDIHPLVILISIYIGINVFGILGILVGPMYSILAKEIIYSNG